MRGIHSIACLGYSALICAAMACGSGGCDSDGAPGAPGADAQTQTLTLSSADVTQVRRGRIATGPRISGSTALAQTATVRAELGGPISAVEVQRGQSVRQGQILARIQTDAVAANVDSARVALRSSKQQLNVARAELRRTQKLVEQGAFAPNRIDIPENQAAAARTQVSQAEAALTAAQEARDDATLRAPIDGLINERAVDVGDVVSMGSLLFTVVDPKSVQFEASASAEFADMLKVGSPVEFGVRGYPERAFRGRIERVNPVAQTQTRQIPLIVKISKDDKNQGVMAGLFAEGRVVSQSREGLLVAQEAVDQDGERTSAMVLRDGRIERVQVDTGLVDAANATVEILAGLRAGEYLLVGSAARDIEAGTPVELKIDASNAPSGEASDAPPGPNIGGGPADATP